MLTPLALMIGLGNPGQQYAKTRHNAGIWWANTLAKHVNVSLKPVVRFHTTQAILPLSAHCRLCCSTTYMNESGIAVGELARYYKIAPEEILIIHDDIDLLPGQIRLKIGGGTGGHNGLKSIEQHLSSKQFNRLRIGIGHPGHADAVKDYVLSTPSATDQRAIEENINFSLQCIESLLSGEFETVMHTLHTQTDPPS
jgi:peptidyl-tRNA hydrolase, PTH1 family